MKESERRALLRQYVASQKVVADAWAARGYGFPPPRFPAFPEALRGLCCGAKTRAGTPCKLTAVFLNGRCKLHGGLSTGPTSEAGKAISRTNGKRGGRPKRNPTP